jgi:hypothetical protein
MSKKTFSLATLAVFMVSMFAITQTSFAQAKKSNIIAAVRYVSGNVMVWPYSNPSSVKLKKGDYVYQGDLIETKAGGNAILIMVNGSEITVMEKTKFKFDFPERGKPDVNMVKLDIGNIVGKIIKGIKMKVKTPTAVASIRGTWFDMTQEQKGAFILNVLEGLIEVQTAAGISNVGENESTKVDKGAGATTGSGTTTTAPVVIKTDPATIAAIVAKIDVVLNAALKEEGKEVPAQQQAKKEEPKKEAVKEAVKEQVKEEAKETKKDGEETVTKPEQEEIVEAIVDVIIPEPEQPPIQEVSPSSLQ